MPLEFAFRLRSVDKIVGSFTLDSRIFSGAPEDYHPATTARCAKIKSLLHEVMMKDVVTVRICCCAVPVKRPRNSDKHTRASVVSRK